MVGSVISMPYRRPRSFRSAAHVAVFVFFMTLVPTAYAIEPDLPASIQQPQAAHLQSSHAVADALATFTWWISRTYQTTTGPNHITPTSRHITTIVLSACRTHLLGILLYSLCVGLMTVSFVVEQKSSPVRLWLALCLAFAWLVPISLHLHKLIRKFQRRGRVDSFIVATAMLSFLFIKAFAILGGYSIAALMRVPPCFTLAAWIASRWCKFDANPEIRFGA